jgi:hypothetical protein
MGKWIDSPVDDHDQGQNRPGTSHLRGALTAKYQTRETISDLLNGITTSGVLGCESVIEEWGHEALRVGVR